MQFHLNSSHQWKSSHSNTHSQRGVWKKDKGAQEEHLQAPLYIRDEDTVLLSTPTWTGNNMA